MSDSKLERWRRIARILPREPPGLTAEELRKLLQERTGTEYQQKMIKRDLDEMEEKQDPPLHCGGDRADTHYWIPPHFKGFDVTNLSLDAALTLGLTLRELADLLPEAAKAQLEGERARAVRVLERHRADPSATWLDHVRVVPRMHPLIAPPVDPDVISTVKEALLAKKQLEIEYAPAPREGKVPGTKVHRISVLGLVRQHPVFTLIVYKPDKPIFVLNLDRIRSARVLSERARRPADFALDGYIRDGHLHHSMSTRWLRLKLETTPAIAQIWRDAQLGTDQVIVGESATQVTVSATVPDTFALRAYLRGFGSEMRVLGPKELRDEFESEAERTLARYRTGAGRAAWNTRGRAPSAAPGWRSATSASGPELPDPE